VAEHWRSETDAGGIVWLHLDVARAGANVLSAEVLDELEQLLAAIGPAPPKGVVFASDKPSGFIAGADVKEFRAIQKQEDALALVRRGQGVMDRIENLPCPTVAIINGFCLGGGLELALACDYRVALEDAKTRLGLPEIRLGIHPGFGGTVRAIRLLGPPAALDLMLSGKTVDVWQAHKLGLIDHAVPARHLARAACRLIETLPNPRRAGRFARMLNLKPARWGLSLYLQRRVAAKAKREHYPAPYALIDLWKRYGHDEGLMLDREADSVADLSMTETARNLVRVFLLQDRLKSLGDKGAFRPRHVHVIGAGAMGGDIAAWLSLQGLRVTVQDRRADSLTATLTRARKLFTKRLRARDVASTMDRLIPDPKGFGLARAEVVIEAIFENLEAKQALYREIEPKIRPDTLLATNTSSLSLERLATGLEDPGRLVGLHFFNPVAEMPLVEVVRSAACGEAEFSKALAFTRRIDKLPLPICSAPGFLVNRVLTPYLLEAMTMLDEGVPVEAIDQAARDFGMPMGPLELADVVGLDIVLAAGETLAREYDFTVPIRLREMVAAGKLGRKSGAGFYVYKHGKALRARRRAPSGEALAMQQRLIAKLSDEAVACLDEGIVEDADLVDAGVIFGAGYAPFRGGPLHDLARRRNAQAVR
jgi:3-hydroxyacyl-CoA dehydrogenase / enoyl-CoA hydratase / 3-hydroxybutyryl-CoA epimerase